VAYGNNVFVAVASSGNISTKIMTSTDNGATWQSRTSAADNMWRLVAWGNDTFVAVASSSALNNQVQTSVDGGVTWRSGTIAADNQL